MAAPLTIINCYELQPIANILLVLGTPPAYLDRPRRAGNVRPCRLAHRPGRNRNVAALFRKMLTKPADHDPTPSGSGETMSASIFVSYASSDRNQVDRLVTFLEAHHFTCWVSYRDVGVGENYQESITRAVRAAKVLIVVFTRNANASSEVQKELSLASRYKLLVIPLRIEDVEPGDALSYELATHQWVDLFRNWSAGCERLLSQLSCILSAEGAAGTKPRPLSPELAAAVAGRPAAPSRPGFAAPRPMPGNPSTAAAAMPAASVATAAAPALPARNSIEPDHAV